jgi:hypothetical protein
MFLIPTLIYLLLCLLVGLRGRHTPLGYLGAVLMSIFFTPILVFIALVLLTQPGARAQGRDDRRLQAR